VAEINTSTNEMASWDLPTAMTVVHCAHCGEAHLLPGETVPAHCPYCLQGPVARQPTLLRKEPPEQVVPFAISPTAMAQVLQRWSRGVRFRPNELNPTLLVRRAYRYFIPVWLVDTRVVGVWRADVGFDYQVVSYQDRYSDVGGWRSEEVREDRIRWEPRIGRIERRYDNVAAPALEDHWKLLARLGEYDLAQRESYQPEILSGGVVRIPTLDPQAAWPEARMAIDRMAGEECRQASGGNHIRGFTIEAEYQDLHWTQLLIPAYVTWYQEEGKVWPVLINGQTGQVSGPRLASSRKANTTALVLGVLAVFTFLLGGILALLGTIFSPAAIIGGVLLVIGVLIGLTAPWPAIMAWSHNRRISLDEFL